MKSTIECKQIIKRFGGLDALKNVSLQVNRGERRAIIGPNGAGKTTLFRILSGEFLCDSGSVWLFEKDVTKMEAYKRAHLGVGRTFQINNLFSTLSVLDNLILSQAGLKKLKFPIFRPVRRYQDLHQKAMEMLTKMGMEYRAGELVRYLSYGEQRQIEIAMALINEPRILLFDEPTAGLSPAESKRITKIIQGLDPRITILIIEHDMDVAFNVAEKISVLNFGEVFTEGTQAEIQASKEVRKIYFGAEWRR